MSTCELNQIFLGEVASVQNYGAFIRIPGCAQQGLIHRTQISTSHVDDVGDILQKGERVWCKIITLGENGKIGLSMKHVNQGNGKDLDPNGVKQQMEEQRKKTIVPRERKAIQLEAVLNTTCSKCGTIGHFAKDCFMSPDGKKYELIPEIQDEVVTALPEIKTPSEKVHKAKKTKKKKKKSSSHKYSTDSDSDSNKKKKKKHSKDHKRKKKRVTSSSSSDSDSGNFKPKKRKSSSGETSERHSKKCKRSKSKYSD
ncbi:nucleolar protein of 40 kDa-like [Leptopilina heterotoma]|uniref:nucleolar protein of 40 kDa-like n=1 Tax=Leptopilina heterotoma TaxID=63436 RepID=UPI001CA886C8|nr:nucleolar protein of 40 kDa-like [Leptopilina heterotoma]